MPCLGKWVVGSGRPEVSSPPRCECDPKNLLGGCFENPNDCLGPDEKVRGSMGSPRDTCWGGRSGNPDERAKNTCLGRCVVGSGRLELSSPPVARRWWWRSGRPREMIVCAPMSVWAPVRDQNKHLFEKVGGGTNYPLRPIARVPRHVFRWGRVVVWKTRIIVWAPVRGPKNICLGRRVLGCGKPEFSSPPRCEGPTNLLGRAPTRARHRILDSPPSPVVYSGRGVPHPGALRGGDPRL